MKVIVLLLKRNPRVVLAAIGLGLLGGAANAGLIAMISEQLINVEQGEDLAIKGYAMVVVAALITGIISRYIMIRISERMVAEMRLEGAYQFLEMPQRQLENNGIPRMMATLTNDLPAMAGSFMQIPSLVINATITLGCFVYIGMLSMDVLGLSILFLIASVLSFKWLDRYGFHYAMRSRDALDRLHRDFEAMTLGCKELKLHYDRRSSFFHDEFSTAVGEMKYHDVRSQTFYALLFEWVGVLYFVFMGVLFVVLAGGSTLTQQAGMVTGFAVVVLYLRGPVTALVDMMPMLRQASIVFDKMVDLGLNPLNREPVGYSEQTAPFNQDAPKPTFKSLQFDGVTHTYRRDSEDGTFTLGPIDFELEQGEVLFLVGGNGSGKTTLAKLITGLYAPEDGRVLWNGQRVDEDSREAYRQHFTAIFNDFYIFEQIMGLGEKGLDERAADYLRMLKIDHKVTVEDGRFSTTELSTGQRKRLALVTAYLEDRDIYLFDEWAADQDPEFKEVFYRELVADLKKRGKTVVVISHDDRYFDLGDRILKLADGKVEYHRDSLPQGR